MSFPRLARPLMVLLVVMMVCPVADVSVQAQAPAAVDWVEPRALNVFDFAGQVPDGPLIGHILVYGPAGIARYVSGERVGDTVRVTATLYPRRWKDGSRWILNIPMLGQRPAYDHMGSVAPECWLRLYAGTRDITDEIRWADYVEPGMVYPQRSAAEPYRYPAQERGGVMLTHGPQGVRLPANWGGEFKLYGDYRELTGVFTARVPDAPRVTLVSTQAATFQTYIGPGGVGRFQPLMDQLRRKYPNRHPRIRLARPADANYVLLNYPPMPCDPYDDVGDNLDRPVSGSARLAPDDGMLSADLVFGGPFPLSVAWQDADQSRGPYLSLLPPVDRMTPPEYVLPADAAWNACYLAGNCNDATLQAIHEAVMALRLVYLKVEPRSAAVHAVPLRMVDETWRPASLAATPRRVWLPGVRGGHAGAPPQLPTAARPYGYFSGGRMVGYAP